MRRTSSSSILRACATISTKSLKESSMSACIFASSSGVGVAPERANVLVRRALVHIHADAPALHQFLQGGTHRYDADGADDSGVAGDNPVRGRN